MAGYARPANTARPQLIARRPLLALAPLTIAVAFATHALAQEVVLSNAIVVSAPQMEAPVITRVNLQETPVLQSATDGATVLEQIPGFFSDW